MRNGQSVLEYAVFVGVVAAAVIAMSDYVRRSIQANFKTVEDRINAEAISSPAAPSPAPTPTPPGPTPTPAPDPVPVPQPN